MQYALIDGKRVEAFPSGKAVCPSCGQEMIAKCGTRIIHHWSHFRQRDCDPWWENETVWHRNWKSLFPEECREISHIAPDGETHRCDIKTSSGIYIEVQHSAISDQERLSRESFYKNLIWIVDGTKFERNFDIYHPLPSPVSSLAQDLVWSKAQRGLLGAIDGMFFRISENPTLTKCANPYGRVHGIDEIQQEMRQAYIGHRQYDWIRPRKTWLSATCPVYIDFRNKYLFRLEMYENYLPCVRLIEKSKFLSDVSSSSSAAEVAP